MAIKVEDIFKDFDRSAQYFSKLFEEAERDFEIELGKQWEAQDVETLRRAGVHALTINKVRPIVKLISGIERQSRSDYVAFPEGGEDGLVSDIVTHLLKNAVKTSRSERKLSEQFKRGVIGGFDYLEPYIDYTHDLINGKLKIRNINPMRFYFDPDAEEYDLSDAKFVIKFSPGLSRDQIDEIFPNDQSKIDKLSTGTIDLKRLGEVNKHIQRLDYPDLDQRKGTDGNVQEETYDLLDYYYKKSVKKYYIVDSEAGIVQEAENKEKAEAYVAEFPESKLIIKNVPEIRHARVVGYKVIMDTVAWTYPRWKAYPFIPYFAEWLTISVKDRELQIQGIVRSLRDLQVEYNKRRTQELRHLNSSVNSGIMFADDALTPDEEAKLKEYGSSPGITIKYKAGTQGRPERIPPAPLSQGHAQLAVENAEDLKQASGVNPDLLASTDSDQSGRAILLKQKQGLVMVQELLDNYNETKKLLGKFILSQLGEIYSVETAIKVVGEAFLDKYEEFKQPVMGQDGQPLLNESGQIVTEVNPEVVGQIFNKVLNDSELGLYDVSIGEGAFSETVRMSNWLMLKDMASSGIPVPPEVLIGESTLPQGAKEKIIGALENAQIQAAAAAKRGEVNV